MPETDARPQQNYAEAFFSLRAPRVAIVFPADTPHWDFFARKALWRANKLWGGAGFVLVPHHAGVVSDTLLRAVASYDPDYVVGHQVSWVELLTAQPKAQDMFVDQHGEKVTLETFDANDAAEMPPADDPLTTRARRSVAVACQVYRRRHDTEPLTPDPKALTRWDEAWSHPDESNIHLDDSGHLTPTSAFGVDDGMCLATPSDLAGPWGAWTAALIGAVAEPDLPALETVHEWRSTDPDADSPKDGGTTVGSKISVGFEAGIPEDAAEIAAWFYSHLDRGSRVVNPQPPGRFAHHQDGLTLAVDASTLPPAWDRTAQGLVPVGDAFARRRLTFVVGDTADDFALALIYQRLYGNTFWIHSAWSPAVDGEVGRKARTRLWLVGYRVRQLGHAVVTSASEGAQALNEIVEIIARNARDNEPGATTSSAAGRPDTLKVELPAAFPDRGMLNLAVTDAYSTRLTVPVLIDEKAVTLTATPPALRPPDPPLIGADVAWHVDIRLGGAAMPLGRGLDGEHLAASDSRYETWIRSGNRGVSYESQRWDFVAAGANAEQRLARPRLRMLSLQEWCRVIAAQIGYDVGWSDAGRRARLLERMWGDRALMTADFAGAFTELARAFSPSGKGSKQAYPDGEGVLITGLGGFLTFSAIRDILGPGADDEQQPRDEHDRETRDRLDTYLTRGIIRRGLVLGCHMCEAPSFVPIDDIHQINRCPRCGSLNDLTLDAWRMPTDEPQWYYDLHQVARDFLRDNGHAPAQLAHYLSRRARDYADCAEMNLLRRGTRSSIAEVDLVAFADGRLLTAEVKTCDYIGNTTAERMAAANKRLHWAAVLQADEIVLASTEASWQPSSIEAMRTKLADAISAGTFAPDRTPRLRLLNNLGAMTLTETYVDI